MTDYWAEAREQLRGYGLLADVEAEVLGDDPTEAAMLQRLSDLLRSRRHARDTLLVARARGDEDAIAESRALYDMAVREVRSAASTLTEHWNDEGARR